MSGRLGGLWRSPAALIGAVGRGFVRGIDFLLRRTRGVEEFTHEDGCILRLALSRAVADRALSDGTLVRRGDPVGELHLWNERIPPMGAAGPDLAWGLRFYRRLVHSLGLLSACVESDPRFDSILAFRGETAFALPDVEAGVERMARTAGFDFVRVPYASSRWGRFAEFWENFYSLMLIWTYNPASLRGKGPFTVRRYQLWISRQTLRERYGGTQRGLRGGARRTPGEVPQSSPEVP